MRYLVLVLVVFLCVDASAQMGSTLRPNRLKDCVDSFDCIDSYDSIAFIYSLAKISRCYDGPCIQVARSSDGALMDIDYRLDYIDTFQLKNFVGSDTGYVKRFYNQLGTTFGDLRTNGGIDQGNPYIMAGGDIIYNRGEVAIYFDEDTVGNGANAVNDMFGDTYTPTDSMFSTLAIYEAVDTAPNVRAVTITAGELYSFSHPSLPDTTFISSSNLFTAPTISTIGGIPINVFLGTEFISFRTMSPTLHQLTMNNIVGVAATDNTNGVTVATRISGSTIRSQFIGYFKEYIGWWGANASNVTSIINCRNDFYTVFIEL